MNKEQRKQAAKRIQMVHDCDATMGCPDPQRAELLTLLADAERENEKLREYEIKHKEWCPYGGNPWYDCTCGLDELLEKTNDRPPREDE